MVTLFKRKISHKAHDLLFKTVHSRSLIYNTSWEDPRIDRLLLEMDKDSRVVMLTSAGCNTLDYLLDSPQEVHAIDVNPRQNALLQLKLALIERGVFDDLFSMFGHGAHANYRHIYREVRSQLSNQSAKFWDTKINYFDNNSKKRSFYYYGTSGLFAWLMSRYLMKNPQIRTELLNLLDAQDLDEQAAIYQRLEPLLWGKYVSRLIRQPFTMSLLGVPRPQIRLITEQYPGGILGYLGDKIKHVSTSVLMHDNYFWRVYLTGSYTETCCPNYLKQENFDLLQTNNNRVHVHNATISNFLKNNPGDYTHFILLDHQDWLAQHDPEALEEEWQLILKNSRPGSRILMRSAAIQVDFIPETAKAALRFFPELTDRLHLRDRVGTYGSLHFAEVI
ncbi:MAG: BtaA family protein [Gammaproteobacteria bacterium]|jgi:S-adenosylmethionine-diacylglycerol 3-amino-3-carboxypropyl transferase